MPPKPLAEMRPKGAGWRVWIRRGVIALHLRYAHEAKAFVDDWNGQTAALGTLSGVPGPTVVPPPAEEPPAMLPLEGDILPPERPGEVRGPYGTMPLPRNLRR